MSLMIRGMTMPKACVYRENGHLMTCPLYDIDGYCKALNTEARHKENEKLSCCPLVPIQQHGRLIDADALMKHKGNCYDADGHLLYAVGTGSIMCAPTIIPAEPTQINAPNTLDALTNADRIRAMTDEELAEWMAKYCERKTVFCPNFGAHDCQESCEQCWLDWLKEVTE